MRANVIYANGVLRRTAGLDPTQMAPEAKPARDPCNFPEVYKPAENTANLWPPLQTKGGALRHKRNSERQYRILL